MNCKPGDLAYIVGGYPENIGAIVTVSAPEFDKSAELNRRIWIVTFRGELRAKRTHVAKERGCIPDSYLRPISGVPVTDDVTDEVTA